MIALLFFARRRGGSCLRPISFFLPRAIPGLHELVGLPSGAASAPLISGTMREADGAGHEPPCF